MRYKQERFCQEYLIDGDATKAAIRAGYAKRSAASIGCDLLKHPEVLACLDKLKAELKERTMVKAEEVIAELWNVGRCRLDQLAQWDQHGNIILTPSGDLPDHVKSAVLSIKRVDNDSGGSVEVKMHDKVLALDKLARVLGLYQDRVDVTSNGDAMPVPIIMMGQSTTINV